MLKLLFAVKMALADFLVTVEEILGSLPLNTL